MKLNEMRAGDRIFLSWAVIVIVGTLVLTLSSEAALEYIKTRSVGSVGGELFSVVLFLVLIPYGIYRLNRKKKSKEVLKE